MAKTKIKAAIARGLAVVFGVILGIYMIPFFLSIILAGLLHVPLDGLDGYTKLLLIRLGGSMADAVAFGISGFLAALLISWFSRNKEIITALFGALIVVIFSDIPKYINTSIMSSEDPTYAAYCILESVLDIIFMLFFAFLGAWLIAKRRSRKVQKSAECSINTEASNRH